MANQDFPKLAKEAPGKPEESSLNKLEALEEVPFAAREELLEKEREKLKSDVLEGISLEEKPARNRLPAESSKAALTLSGKKNQTLLEIEAILEQDLGDVYFKMEPELQPKFKVEGEKTAAAIEKVLAKTKVKTKKIFKLILNWLKMIPGVNKFFIRQEAKIKTDKIMSLKK